MVFMVFMKVFVLLSCCILALHVCSTIALQDVLELDSSLTPASQPLLSASSTFTLSFRNPPIPAAANTTSNLFLAISFLLNSSLKYPAWVANRNTSASASASLNLSSSGELLLFDLSVSSAPLWKSNTAGLGVVRAQLLDSGNLLLLNSRSEYVWQSFDYPTDTLLPGQAFTANSTSLTSNGKLGDFRPGRYSFDFTSLMEVLELNFSINGVDVDSMQFDDLGNITLRASSSSANVSTIITDDHGISGIRRMTLDMDGNMQVYTWLADTAQWSSVWKLFFKPCVQVPQLCGSYGICTYDPIKPVCVCPPGFSVVDLTDLSSGCSANYKMGSDCNRSSVKFVEVDSVLYSGNDHLILPALSIDECKERCLNVCECVAVMYDQNAELCYVKQKAENGRLQMTQDTRTFLKISAADPSISNPTMDRAMRWSSDYLWQPDSNQESVTIAIDSNKYFGAVVALAILIAVEGMCFAATVAAFFTRWKRQLKLTQLRKELEGCPLVFSYEELKASTANFSHQLGEGGFGTVYKGQLQNGKCVAVKQLEGMLQQEKQFRAEIMTIGRIHHMNLLRLVGFCMEGNHRLLVYEYMERGSLDQILFSGSDKSAGQRTTDVLDWGTRFSICLDVARGIHYLHEECLNCILHCDIKPQNILLDGRYCAKVADFGLAYLQSRHSTVKASTIRGTRGYLAPEWVSNLPITSKADVYSYGMLIMEIISGRSNYLYAPSGLVEAGEKWCFPMWAYGKRIQEVVDSKLAEHSIDWEQAEMVLKVAFACIKADMNVRPTMGQVVMMLEGVLPIPDAPPPHCLVAVQEKGSAISSSISSHDKRTTASSSSVSSQAFSTLRNIGNRSE